MPIRKGDEVKIMRASTSAKGREGKVLAVSWAAAGGCLSVC
jgi:ribosomal protein L24